MKSLSRVLHFATPWTVAHYAPLSMGFSRQEYWSGWPFPSPEDLLIQGSNPDLLYCRQMLYRLSHHGSPNLLELTPKRDVLFIIGDWNTKVGSQETRRVTGKFGLGIQNEVGQRLIVFCQENALVISNTLFQQHKKRLYTLTSPDGQH